MRKRSQGTNQTVGPILTSPLTLQHEPSPPEYYIRQELIPLPFGPRGEQQEIGTWKTLISDPDFREDIKQAKELLGSTYWQTLSHSETISQQLEKQLSEACTPLLKEFHQKNPSFPISVLPAKPKLRHVTELERLSVKWGLNDLKDGDWWLEHVLRFWDPTSEDAPPLEAPMRSVPLDLHSGSLYVRPRAPLFKTIIASVEYFAPSLKDSSKSKPRRAVITLRPGVSLRQARHAVAKAVKRLDLKARKHRPPLTDLDRGILRMLFDRHEPSLGKQSRLGVIRSVHQQMRDWHRPVSVAKIGDEFRLFLKEKGHIVREYMTERRDLRT